VAEDLLTDRRCLVHGDFSPKNVLVGGRRLWVLDWEVAHVGNPVFDLAYLLCHLILKIVHRPGHAHSYRETARRFLAAYGRTPDGIVGQNVGCLLLARVDGKSPADYLTEADRGQVRALGRSFVQDGAGLAPFLSG
jgi:5-methylthioribose kinase